MKPAEKAELLRTLSTGLKSEYSKELEWICENPKSALVANITFNCNYYGILTCSFKNKQCVDVSLTVFYKDPDISKDDSCEEIKKDEKLQTLRFKYETEESPDVTEFSNDIIGVIERVLEYVMYDQSPRTYFKWQDLGRGAFTLFEVEFVS